MFKLSFLSLLLVSSFASAEEARRADAHVHGLNNLSMVISQNQVAISYEMPIVQLFDEHDNHDEHEGHDEMVVSNDLLAEFQNYLQLFAFPKDAECALVSFESGLHAVSTEGGHKDVELSYEFSCNEPSQLKSITINAFNRFSELETLNFEAVINNKALTKSLKSGVDKVIF
ncbi:MAG: hypothetical protein CMO25_01635 [Thiotrichales bacterium]|nr:hypothetical protein [Thiotrichales bacterium]